ncbi:MAG: hypothetical protein QOD06_2292, partial [Candidatus Binatota bacterium]|nr:hypothetical protein [Candidatus Binatota bacterium]
VFRTVLVTLIATAACGTRQQEDPLAGYKRALAGTVTAEIETIDAGSNTEKDAVRRFVAFYEVYSVERVRAHVREVYADNAYFRDSSGEFSGIDAVEKYLLTAAEGMEECRIDFQDIARHDGHYYFRWIMKYQVRRNPNRPLDEAVGMSHVRFDRAGKVVFQNDYLDSGSLAHEHVPVIGWLFRR